MARCGGEPLAAIARQTSVVHHEATSRATAWREPCPLHGTPLRRRDARERCSHEINQRCRSSFHPLTIEPPPSSPPPPTAFGFRDSIDGYRSCGYRARRVDGPNDPRIGALSRAASPHSSLLRPHRESSGADDSGRR